MYTVDDTVRGAIKVVVDGRVDDLLDKFSEDVLGLVSWIAAD